MNKILLLLCLFIFNCGGTESVVETNKTKKKCFSDIVLSDGNLKGVISYKDDISKELGIQVKVGLKLSGDYNNTEAISLNAHGEVVYSDYYDNNTYWFYLSIPLDINEWLVQTYELPDGCKKTNFFFAVQQ